MFVVLLVNLAFFTMVSLEERGQPVFHMCTDWMHSREMSN